MDIRKDFENVLDLYGHYVLLIRQNTKVRCRCWNESRQEANKKCPNCLGTGYHFTAEKHLCRSDVQAIPETLPRISNSTQAGEFSVDSKMFYMKHTVRPSKGDLICEMEWDENDKPVVDEYTSIFEVNYPQPYRGDKGRIEYFRVACMVDPIEASIRLANATGNGYVVIDER
ncbi:MAG: hypothetical protein NWF07_11395 [Candidatus Bathyarchaeota archaeon]|nr:hypothetical protein [Candidatus Bathyarchaeota archaeon]